jgi:6,7-dimethyl-8-ribityllumazine synthase
MKICIISAEYYKNISKNLFLGAKTELDKHNKFNKKYNIKYEKIVVPGVFEIPFIVSFNIKKFDAFVTLGCVIKGETPHFDFISSAATNAIINLSVQEKKPITNGIITCLNIKQAQIRSDLKKKNKGGEAAIAAIKLLSITNRK